jgi:hypothetical protein
METREYLEDDDFDIDSLLDNDDYSLEKVELVSEETGDSVITDCLIPVEYMRFYEDQEPIQDTPDGFVALPDGSNELVKLHFIGKHYPVAYLPYID